MFTASLGIGRDTVFRDESYVMTVPLSNSEYVTAGKWCNLVVPSGEKKKIIMPVLVMSLESS